jgi:8-oxo-dGTP diphosphatase
VEWVPVDRAAELDLNPGLAAHWAELREGLVPLTVIVDAANVVGSRPDGWWRDRAGAARRLVSGVAELAGAGVSSVPAGLGLPSPARWLPDYVVVLEGQARAAVPEGPVNSGLAGAGLDRAGLDGAGRLRVVGAPGSGDDTIAELAGELPGRRLVVTADRELRARCQAAGAQVTGPRWLTERLDG